MHYYLLRDIYVSSTYNYCDPLLIGRNSTVRRYEYYAKEIKGV